MVSAVLVKRVMTIVITASPRSPQLLNCCRERVVARFTYDDVNTPLPVNTAELVLTFSAQDLNLR